MNIDDNILAIARSQYEPDGPNQWTHILRVLRQAESIAKWRKNPLSEEEQIAVLFHDSAKWLPEYAGHDHGESSAKHTYSILKDRIRKSVLDRAVKAIAAHNYDRDPQDPIAELLMASDGNIPNIGWYLRKSYNHAKHQLAFSHEDAVKNAYEWAKKGSATMSTKRYIPKVYLEAFAEDIIKTNEEVARLTVSDVWPLIQRYEKEHHTSIFE